MSIQSFALPVGDAFGALYRTVRQRVTEAGLTTGLEILLVLFGVRNGWFNVFHPNGYTLGWKIVGSVVPQEAFGVFLLLFASVRGPVVILGGYRPRIALGIVGLFVSLSVDIMVRKANPDSPTIPMQDMIAATNLWIVGSLIFKDWRRGHP